MTPLLAAAGIFAAILLLRRARVRAGIVYAVAGIAAWVAVLKSGVAPVVVGLVLGLLTVAYPAARTDLERASDLFHLFREQPTAELAQSAWAGLATALSPNERLQQPVLRELLAGRGDVQYVWRHLPLNDVHPRAQLAAEAAEAAADQGRFWEMHDLLLTYQDHLLGGDLIRYAGDIGAGTARFSDYLRKRAGAARIAEDVDSADLSGVSGTPISFINGRRHYGSYDITALTAAVLTAKAAVAAPDPVPDPGHDGRLGSDR